MLKKIIEDAAKFLNFNSSESDNYFDVFIKADFPATYEHINEHNYAPIIKTGIVNLLQFSHGHPLQNIEHLLNNSELIEDIEKLKKIIETLIVKSNEIITKEIIEENKKAVKTTTTDFSKANKVFSETKEIKKHSLNSLAFSLIYKNFEDFATKIKKYEILEKIIKFKEHLQENKIIPADNNSNNTVINYFNSLLLEKLVEKLSEIDQLKNQDLPYNKVIKKFFNYIQKEDSTFLLNKALLYGFIIANSELAKLPEILIKTDDLITKIETPINKFKKDNPLKNLWENMFFSKIVPVFLQNTPQIENAMELKETPANTHYSLLILNSALEKIKEIMEKETDNPEDKIEGIIVELDYINKRMRTNSENLLDYSLEYILKNNNIEFYGIDGPAAKNATGELDLITYDTAHNTIYITEIKRSVIVIKHKIPAPIEKALEQITRFWKKTNIDSLQKRYNLPDKPKIVFRIYWNVGNVANFKNELFSDISELNTFLKTRLIMPANYINEPALIDFFTENDFAIEFSQKSYQP